MHERACDNRLGRETVILFILDPASLERYYGPNNVALSIAIIMTWGERDSGPAMMLSFDCFYQFRRLTFIFPPIEYLLQRAETHNNHYKQQLKRTNRPRHSHRTQISLPHSNRHANRTLHPLLGTILPPIQIGHIQLTY